MIQLNEDYYEDPHTLLANLAAFPNTVQEVKGILEKNTEAGYLSIKEALEEIKQKQTMPLEVWAYVYYMIHYSYPRNGRIYLGSFRLQLPQYAYCDLLQLQPLETFMTEAQLKEYAPESVLRREKGRRVQALCDANLNTIKLDTFSYTLFANALKASGKITIKDSLKYFEQLRKLMRRNSSEEIQRLMTKYVKIIFNSTRNPNREVYLAVNGFQYILDDEYCKDMPFVCIEHIPIQTISAVLEELKNHTKVAISFSSIAVIIENSIGIIADDVLSACNIRTPSDFYTSDKVTGSIVGDDIFEDSHNNQGATIIMYTLLLHTSQFNETLRTSAWFKIILDKFREHIDPTHEDMQELVKTTAQLEHYFAAARTVMNKMKELHAKEGLCNSS
ncbi:MAG: hypothetical protein LR001_05320 [Clostridiales bacterium]|nr:hypothetical protein [Clostridiales bacterium]